MPFSLFKNEIPAKDKAHESKDGQDERCDCTVKNKHARQRMICLALACLPHVFLRLTWAARSHQNLCDMPHRPPLHF